MAVPHAFDDSTDLSDRAPQAADNSHSNLSANMWDSMKNDSNGLRSPSDTSSHANESEIVFTNDIYGNDPYGVPESTVRLTSTPAPRGDRAAPKPADNCPIEPVQDLGPLNYVEDLQKYADKNFDKIDSDQDGSLSEKELDEALKDECLTGEDRKAIEILQKHRHGFEDLSDDEFGPENDGITRNDLGEFGKIAAKQGEAEDMYSYAKKNMSKLDRDGDGQLNQKELDEAINACDPDSEAKRLLERMKEQYEELQSSSNDEWGFDNDGISVDDLLRNASSEAVGWDETGFLMDVSSDVMKHWLNRQADLYKDESLRPTW